MAFSQIALAKGEMMLQVDRLMLANSLTLVRPEVIGFRRQKHSNVGMRLAMRDSLRE
jgi:hypothetical protein